MTRSVYLAIPASEAESANATLESMGHGPGNFSVPVREPGGTYAAKAICHWWDAPVAAIEAALPNVTVSDQPFEQQSAPEHVRAAVAAEGLEWTDPANWHENPVMKGDEREHDGKTWVSTVDYNVWEPGVSGWREKVSEGYPAWVRPTGAHDAYSIGDFVTHNGRIWECTQGDGAGLNSWEPGVFGWTDRGPA